METVQAVTKNENEIRDFHDKASLVRKWCLVSTTEAKSGHPTSCLSAADITTVLFDKYFTYDIENPLNLYNDRFVLSKGHAAPLLYTLFGMCGAYPLEQLKSLRKFGSEFEGHPVPRFPFAEAATGSLGQGLSVGAGLALVDKRGGIPSRIYVLLGDGEMAEGQVWEAANFASFHQLSNLVAIVDVNRLAQSGETMFGHQVEKYASRLEGFGFEILNIDGHDFTEIDRAFAQIHMNEFNKPVAVIAKTVKGRGISFLEDKEGWHGKALNVEELNKALSELGAVNDDLRFNLRKPIDNSLANQNGKPDTDINLAFEKESKVATREAFGMALEDLGKRNRNIFVFDGDVKNSTFTEDFMKSESERFVECYIAEQNMVSAAAGMSRAGKIPFVATFAAFLTRAADQIRMARVSEANIKFVGSHVGVSIGEDGASQMGLEDISLFATIPDSIVLQPADAVSAAKLTALMLTHTGISYMRTLRPKTAIIYKSDQPFKIGGLKILRKSNKDLLTVAATGITVHEALKAAEELDKDGISIRVVDVYSVKPIDKEELKKCLDETSHRIILSVEDHFEHGGLGDIISSELSEVGCRIEKLAVKSISSSGTMEELMHDAGIDKDAIIKKVKDFSS